MSYQEYLKKRKKLYQEREEKINNDDFKGFYEVSEKIINLDRKYEVIKNELY